MNAVIASRMTAPIITPSMKLIPINRLLFQVGTVYTRKKMDSSEKKKIVIGLFNFREVLRPFLEPGRSAPFPGASRMIREVSHVCIILWILVQSDTVNDLILFGGHYDLYTMVQRLCLVSDNI